MSRATVHRSLWLREALRGEADQSPLVGAQRADIAIIGGGYVGLWTALRLKEHAPSCDVALIEQDVCGGGAPSTGPTPVCPSSAVSAVGRTSSMASDGAAPGWRNRRSGGVSWRALPSGATTSGAGAGWLSSVRVASHRSRSAISAPTSSYGPSSRRGGARIGVNGRVGWSLCCLPSCPGRTTGALRSRPGSPLGRDVDLICCELPPE